MFSDHDETIKSFHRSSFSSVGSLFHARGAATEKALSVANSSYTYEARSVDRLEILATDVRRSQIYSGVCPRNDYEPASTACRGPTGSSAAATGNQCNSRRVTRSRGLRYGACRCVQNSLEKLERCQQCGSWKTASTALQ